ncbi:MAG: LamG domain-containing protein [Oscillospiraceae bacterium]|nr:LamG domain-containing protein [Oscillospiraceae bacterium]MDD4413321.1 LamG domain-containing protein [Oscillospiraceae bacterium]
MNRNSLRFLSLFLSAALLISISSVWTVGATKGYTDRQLWLVNEPDGQSSYVGYYVNGKEKSKSEMEWVDIGHTGKAISLLGKGQSLEIGYYQLQMHTMTFSGWFYWRGSAEGMDKESMYSQRLLTISHSDDTWLTVMPHAKDTSKKDKSGNILDGVFMEFEMGKGKNKVNYEFYNPAKNGIESYGLPLNEWHHIALTMDGQYLRLFIDGQLWFEKMLILGFEEMRNNILSVGSGRWDDPTLNALIDDMVVYDYALSPERITKLYNETNSRPSGSGTTTPSSIKSTDSSSAAGSDNTNDAGDGKLFGLPTWTVWMAGFMVLIFAALSVFISVYKPAAPANPKEKNEKGGSDR